MSSGAALIYAVLAEAAALFQVALLAGAPWGRLTMGGRWPGRLPPVLRAWAAAQAALLGLMALAVLAAAGVMPLALPAWTGWAALAVTALSAVANLVTPSRPERLLWGPVTLAMLATGLVAVTQS